MNGMKWIQCGLIPILMVRFGGSVGRGEIILGQRRWANLITAINDHDERINNPCERLLTSARQGSCVLVKGGWVTSMRQNEESDLVPLNLVNMELSIAQAFGSGGRNMSLLDLKRR